MKTEDTLTEERLKMVRDIVVEFQHITPEKAEEWIEKTDKAIAEGRFSQRSCPNQAIEDLALHMRNGTFVLTHQAIALNADGFVMDGQTRLRAISSSEKGQVLLVVQNMPEQQPSLNGDVPTITVMDRGRKRTVNNAWQIAYGRKDGGLVSSLVNIVVFLASNRWAKLTAEQVHRLEALFLDEITLVREQFADYRKPPVTLMGALVAMACTDPSKARDYCELYCGDGSGIHAVERIKSIDMKRFYGAGNRVRLLKTMASALSAYRSGTEYKGAAKKQCLEELGNWIGERRNKCIQVALGIVLE